MLTLLRQSPKCSRLHFTRSFAEVVSVTTSQASKSLPATTTSSLPQSGNTGSVSTEPSSPQSVAPIRLGSRVPVREDHGLYGFFRKRVPEKEGEVLEGEARYETLGGTVNTERAQSGRSWKASELRLKSFQDLHTLWYVLLRERNLLATQEEEVRRLGVYKLVTTFSYKKRQCKKSMARIKAVINERRLAYEGAVQLAEKEKQDHLDNVVLQHQVAEFRKERAYLAKRRAYIEKKQAEKEKAIKAAVNSTENTAVEEAERAEAVTTVGMSESGPSVQERSDIKENPEVKNNDRSITPESASDAATAGLLEETVEGGRRRR